MTYGRAIKVEVFASSKSAAVSHGLTSSPQWGEGSGERITMSNVDEASVTRPPLAERLAQSADGVLEQIAREYGVSTF